MEDSQAFGKDPVESFLDAHFVAALDVKLRHTLLMQTTRVLHRRRCLKRIGYVAALVGCYSLGLATMQLRLLKSPIPTATATVLPDDHATVDGKFALAPTPALRPAQPAQSLDRDPEIPAFVLERMAQSCQEQRSDLYRRAGDRYLADGDFKSAVHCYSRSLDARSERDWAVSKDDSWLLIHLKTARQEEKPYAKSAG